MGRCTLCGGRLDGSGRCMECGLDNSKNDRKYHLNIHNEKGETLHAGNCESNLNRGGGYEKLLNKRRKTAETGEAHQESSKRPEQTREQAAERRRRSQSGTVKKKGSLLSWFWVLILVLALLWQLVSDFGSDMIGTVSDEIFLQDEPGDAVTNIADGEDGQTTDRPKLLELDSSDPLYVEQTLDSGFYTCGYEIPAGTYQVLCQEGNGWIYWTNPDDEYDNSVCLYSIADQQEYGEYMEKTCPFYEVSEMITLEEGAVLLAETAQQKFLLQGMADEKAGLSEHEPQEGLSEVEMEETMTCGEDFEPGVYDIVVDNGGQENGAGGFLTVTRSDNSYYISLWDGPEQYYRFPFEEGDTLETELYGYLTRMRLVPSY